MTKSELRRYIREQFRGTTPAELSCFSETICKRILSNKKVKDAKIIMAFYPLKDEVDICNLLRQFVEEGKRVYLPEVVSETDMIIREYLPEEQMTEGVLGTSNPTGEILTNYEEIEVVLTPGQAFDREGRRMGRGRGYYDRFFAHASNIYKIGVCFPYQLVEKVPCDENDVNMDEVISIF